jgi:hypothetical protein
MSKHRFLTHSFATDVATRSLAHRALSLALTRTLSVAFVGASITLLAACGSTAADIATKEAAEAARRAALEEAELSAPTPRPEDPGSVELGIMTPHSNGGTTSQSGNVDEFTATGLTITGEADEARGVSKNIGTAQSAVTGYTFADLKLSHLSPTPRGAQGKNNDVPFLLIWQFKGAKTEGAIQGQTFTDRFSATATNGKFIAPGIARFRNEVPADADDFPTDQVASSKTIYLEQMLENFQPNDEIDEDPTQDLTAETPRPIPYANLYTGVAEAPGAARLGRVMLSGSSTFWSATVDATTTQDPADPDAVTAEDDNIPAYDVELIFPKRYSGDNWALEYSGFVLMRALYTGGSLATGAPQAYINLFTYTNKDAGTDTEPMLKKFFAEGGPGEGKSVAKATYTSVFAGWGVAAANPNLHTYLYDAGLTLTARFNKNGGGTLSGTIKPKMKTTGGTTVNKDSGFDGDDGTAWSGSDNKARHIVLEDVKWDGYTGDEAKLKGTAKVVYAEDGTHVSAYDSYRHLATVLSDPTKVPGLTDAQRTLLELTPQELAAAQNQVQAQRKALEEALSANYNNFKGKFAGPKAEELVAEMKLQSSENDEPTVIGGVSGHRYDYANLE